MSRVELDQIQTQLKSAILNHQILVSRLQLQPQETGLKAQLHNLQKEIIIMCKKQKLVVEKLGKDIIEKKPCDALKNTQVLKSPSTQPKTDVSNQSCLPIIAKPQTTIPVKSCDSPQCVSDQGATEPSKYPVSKTSTPSPIRVPQYSATRPSILQNNNFITKDQSVILNRRSPTEESKTQKSTDGPDLKKLEEQKQLKKKISFMASLELVPPDTLKEVPCKRSERKRKSTNNPNFAYGFELETSVLFGVLLQKYFRSPGICHKFHAVLMKRPRLSNFLASDYFGAKKSKTVNQPLPSDSSSSTSPEDTSSPVKRGKENVDEKVCSNCGRNGQLLMCDKCSSVYHLQCINPPLENVPDGQWICNKCQEAHRKSLSLAAVNAYISNKTGKEEEKRKLLKRSAELLQEKQHIENRTQQLNEILTKQGLQKEELIQINRNAQRSVENLRKFVELVQTS